jgi:ATP-dependent DNA ligase
MAKAKTLIKATFIESMECLPISKLPEGSEWTYEIKLDGYRLEAVKNGGVTTLYSRRANVLNGKFQYIADALKKLPDGTVIDGEVVAMERQGRADLNFLQNFRSAASQIHYFAFDVLIAKGKRVTDLPLSERREILSKLVKENDHVSLAVSDTSAARMLKFVRGHGLEGIVAKRADGIYEPVKRSGLWSKYRINAAQEFVVGGYTPGTET